jgi:hypothetical protein
MKIPGHLSHKICWLFLIKEEFGDGGSADILERFSHPITKNPLPISLFFNLIYCIFNSNFN